MQPFAPRDSVGSAQVLQLQAVPVEWNRTDRDYGVASRLHRLVEGQVARSPDSVAVIHPAGTLTYGELNQRANQLGRFLRRQGVSSDGLVAVYAKRSPETVLAALAILKAGGAYLPLDPAYPAARIANMLEDAKASLVLAQPDLAPELDVPGQTLHLLDPTWEAYRDESDENLEECGAPEDLAYVIFTSGSTGRPKGAMNEHRGICNQLLWMKENYDLGPEDRILHKTTLGFDTSVEEIFAPLVAGARLIIARQDEHLDGSALLRLIRDQQVTVIDCVPSLLRVLLDDETFAQCTSLRYVFCGGEALSPSLQETFFEVCPDLQLINLYGPSETSIQVTHWTCQPGDGGSSVPIGRPVANTRIYVLNPILSPSPSVRPVSSMSVESRWGGVMSAERISRNSAFFLIRLPVSVGQGSTGQVIELAISRMERLTISVASITRSNSVANASSRVKSRPSLINTPAFFRVWCC